MRRGKPGKSGWFSNSRGRLRGVPKPVLAIKEKKQAVEREEILRALETHRWNKTRTAEALGMSRRSLLYKIKEYGIA